MLKRHAGVRGALAEMVQLLMHEVFLMIACPAVP